MLRVDKRYRKRLLNWALCFSSLNFYGVYLARGSRVHADLEIGQGTRINGSAVVKGLGMARIGKYCAIGDDLRLITSNHYLHALAIQNKVQQDILGTVLTDGKRGITIGHDVWIGDLVTILPGVEIGHGAVIGAGAVVTRSVDAYAVVAGNPARKVSQRFQPEVIDRLLDLKWWDWSIDQMRQRADFFRQDFSQLSVEQLESRIKSLNNADG